MITIKETTKLYYNKYAYKAVVYNQYAYRLGFGERYYRFRVQDEDTRDLLDLLQDRDVRKRGEGYHVSIFTNDWDLIETLKQEMAESLEEIWQPDESKTHLLKNANTVLVKTKPTHPIRVTFNDKKIKSDFTKWIDANPDKIKIGESAYKSVKRGWMVGGLYFGLRDKKVLSLVNLMIGENIRRIDHLVCDV